MKKPLIKNWIKYWTSTLAVSGLLVMGACGGAEDTEYDNEIEAAENELGAPAREYVNEAIETDADDLQTADSENDVDYTADGEESVLDDESELIDVENADPNLDDFPATYIDDMDEFIREHEAVNEQITDALVDNNSNLDPGSTPAMYENQANPIEEAPEGYFTVLEIYRPEYTPEDQKLMDDIINEYNARREALAGQPDETTGVYVSPEEEPSYPEGIDALMEDIQDNLIYPNNAAAAEIEGMIFVNFIVDENGNVTEAKAVKEVIVPVESMDYFHPLNPTKFSEAEIKETLVEMEREAIRAVEATSGRWEPGLQDGVEVKTEVQLPVVFDLQNLGEPEDVPLQE